MLKFKIGVKLDKLQPQMVLALQVANEVYMEVAGVDCVVTSVNDSTHMVGSKHYSGNAVDLRTKHMLPFQIPQVHDELKHLLGHLGYDVVLEKDHIHCEYDPK